MRIVVAAIAVCLSASPAAAAFQPLITGANGDRYEIDTASIGRTGNLRTAWLQVWMGTVKADKITSMKTMDVFDCQGHMYALASVITYGGLDVLNTMHRTPQEYISALEPVAPETIASAIYDKVCSAP